MKVITGDRLELYMVAYEERIQETADSDLTWDQRKFQANDYAADLSPSVAEALRIGMIYRQAKWRHPEKDIEQPLDDETLGAINRLVRWKSLINVQYAKNKYDQPKTRAKSSKNGKQSNGKINISKGYISSWYESWFQDHDRLHARDKELASVLDCTPSAISFARKKMKDIGYEFKCRKGITEIVTRPMSKDRREKIDNLEKYLTHLSAEINQAKEQLDLLII